MKLHDCIQTSPAWWELRRARPTASDFDRICTPAKGDYAKAADTYINELIGAIVRFDPAGMTEKPMNAAMRHGVDCEPEARNWYAFDSGMEVRQVGFVTTDDGGLGCSPDGLVVGNDGRIVGGLELKCPQPATHVSYLRDGKLPTEYKPQVHGQLIVMGEVEWIDFVSYCDGFDPLKVRVVPDDFTATLRKHLDRFLKEYYAAASAVLKVKISSWADIEAAIRRKA